MAGAVRRTDGTTGAPAGSSQGNEVSLLVDKMVHFLTMYAKSGQQSDLTNLSGLCISLARGIDYAVANNQVPSRARDLPLLLRQLCKQSNDFSLQAAVMVLSISVKNTCSIAWFSDKDAADLLSLIKEIGGKFGNTEDIDIEPSYALPSISKVMSRFYPCIKMGLMLASLEIKPGYGAFVADFHIAMSMVDPAQEQIGLIVAQIDNMDTSSCIMTPPQANFLLNGRGVQGRNNVSMDSEPQMPTNVTAMLKNGINLLQAVGQFSGHYIIVIAFMHKMCSSDTPVLRDYVRPVYDAPDSGSEVIEGLSQVSLNCPITHRRIKLPVKGHLCMHYQCFDLENFIETNSRRPLWCCPHCHQPVCSLDIRIDQNMAKILREVGENVVDVMVSSNGSWRADFENEECTYQMCDEIQSPQQQKPLQCESSGFLCVPTNVVDLTMGEANESNDAVCTFQSRGSKYFQDNFPNVSVGVNLMPPELSVNDGAKQNTSTQTGDSFWSGIPYISSDPYGSVGPSTNFHGYTIAGLTQDVSSNCASSSVLSDAISPVLDQGSADVLGANQLPLSLSQNQVFDFNNSQLQHFRVEGSIASNKYSRMPSAPRNISSTFATQASVVQAQVPSSCEQTTTLNLLMPSGPPSATLREPYMVPNIRGSVETNGGTESGQQFPRLPANLVTDIASSSMQSYSLTQLQIRDANDHHCMSDQSLQQVYCYSTGPPSGHQNPDQSNPGLRTIQATAHSQGVVHPSSYIRPEHFHNRRHGFHVMRTVNSKQAQLRASAQSTTSMSRTPPFAPVQLQSSRPVSELSLSRLAGQLRATGELRSTDGTTQPVLRAEGRGTFASTENWQPSGRMRGSLTGAAYAAVHDQFMNQQRQPAQASRPSSEPVPNPHSTLQTCGLINSSTNIAPTNSQVQTHPSSGVAISQPQSSSNIPEWSVGIY